MALVEFWQNSREQLDGKSVKQIIAFAGDGKIRDGEAGSSNEFRDFLKIIPSELLTTYAEQCLAESFTDSGLVLQDVVNEMGRRLGFEVTPGRYRGTQKEIGFDGLWGFRSGQTVVVEVKTTDAYRIDLNVVESYRQALIKDQRCTDEDSSILIVVGRQDTGDLEAQIRGSKQAWDVRLISVSALSKLMGLKEELEDPAIVQQIHSILVPKEFTRLDEIIDIIFLAAADSKDDEVEEVTDGSQATATDTTQPKFTPVAFHQACIERIEAKLGTTLVKRTRTGYSTKDHELGVVCAVSKSHERSEHPGYWFAIHPPQRNFLEEATESHIALGCGSPEKILLIPTNIFFSNADQMNMTHREDRSYWHVHLSDQDGQIVQKFKSGFDDFDLTQYLI